MKSMTGFGTAEGSVGQGQLFIEMKSVNHRFCEPILKIPYKMGAIEGHLRKYIQHRFQRGKIELFIREKTPLFGGAKLSIDTRLAQSYSVAVGKLRRAVGDRERGDFLQYVDLDRFITLEEASGSYERLWKQIERILRKAAQQVDRMRASEGHNLSKDQRERLRIVRMTVQRIRRQSVHSLDQHMKRMQLRMSANGMRMDEERLREEVALLGGRQDVTEELTRLESHIEQYSSILKSNGSVGRKLDFLLQEMHREINTVGSKAADAKISALVVDCKAELERLREQVQNIE